MWAVVEESGRKYFENEYSENILRIFGEYLWAAMEESGKVRMVVGAQ